jgi:DNA-binding XRE family transcriptional regulator
MPRRPDLTDLRGRREELGVSLATMAAGIGLSPDIVIGIEMGSASAAMVAHYEQWLGRLEALPSDRRLAEVFTASAGRRFRL